MGSPDQDRFQAKDVTAGTEPSRKSKKKCVLSLAVVVTQRMLRTVHKERTAEVRADQYAANLSTTVKRTQVLCTNEREEQ